MLKRAIKNTINLLMALKYIPIGSTRQLETETVLKTQTH
jgi:hypothetical protein